jgi:hypothetical protein
MIEFSAKDASILARVAQYQTVPEADRRAILEQADTDDARVVGQILIGDHVQARREIYEAVESVQNWVRENRSRPSAPRRVRALELTSSRSA